MHVDLRRQSLQKLLDARNAAWHAPGLEAAADVVLVGVGDQRAGDRHAAGLGRFDDRLDLPCRVDDDALTRLRVADEIDEVLHRPQLHLLQVDRLVRHGTIVLQVHRPGENGTSPSRIRARGAAR